MVVRPMCPAFLPSSHVLRPRFVAPSNRPDVSRRQVTRMGICQGRVPLRALALAAALSLLPAQAGAVDVRGDGIAALRTELRTEVTSGRSSRQPTLALVSSSDPLKDLRSGDLQKSSEHESKGEKLARVMKTTGLSNEAIVVAVSGMPVVELRAGIPIGIALFGMPPLKVFCLAVFGNMLPIIVLLPLLQLRLARTIFGPLLSLARRKSHALLSSKSLYTALAVFVGVPMPGTGAFTGAFVSFVLGMPPMESFVSIGAGVMLSATIMVILSELGKVGAVLATVALVVFGVWSVLSSPQTRPEGLPSE